MEASMTLVQELELAMEKRFAASQKAANLFASGDIDGFLGAYREETRANEEVNNLHEEIILALSGHSDMGVEVGDPTSGTIVIRNPDNTEAAVLVPYRSLRGVASLEAS